MLLLRTDVRTDDDDVAILPRKLNRLLRTRVFSLSVTLRFLAELRLKLQYIPDDMTPLGSVFQYNNGLFGDSKSRNIQG